MSGMQAHRSSRRCDLGLQRVSMEPGDPLAVIRYDARDRHPTHPGQLPNPFSAILLGTVEHDNGFIADEDGHVIELADHALDE
jgi:hypothetical protein